MNDPTPNTGSTGAPEPFTRDELPPEFELELDSSMAGLRHWASLLGPLALGAGVGIVCVLASASTRCTAGATRSTRLQWEQRRVAIESAVDKETTAAVSAPKRKSEPAGTSVSLP